GKSVVLLGGCGLHFVGGDWNVVGASGDFHCSLANPLENLGEVVQHVVDGVGDVAASVVGDFAAQCHFTARNLIDDRKKLRDAALQRLAGFLIGVSFGDFRDSAVQVFRNVAKLIVRLNVRTGASVTGGEAFREFGKLLD